MKSNEFLTETEKQKGVDGKACWDGYKRMGTKKKGGKTVDNCVKMEESNDEYDDEAGMVDSNLETIKRAAEELDQVLGQDDNMAEWAQEKLAVVKSMIVAVKDYVVSQKSTGIDPQVDEEFDMIESVIESLAVRNQVDAEVIWEDLESLTEDELYVFAVTQETVNEDWQKVNKKDKTDGMSKKAVNAYRRENPGSKLKTAVTTKPSKLKKGSKASKRRKSYCSRSKGQMDMHNISCAKTPDKAICKARRRWNC
jgi:DNA-binding transcriptional regulator YdaS (Cro superfamily)